jgi:hypothetical protein
MLKVHRQRECVKYFSAENEGKGWCRMPRGVYGRLILKLIFSKLELGSVQWMRQVPEPGLSEHVHKPLDSIKCE